MLRSYLYEAANLLLARVAKWSALKAWEMRLAKRSGLCKAKVAVRESLPASCIECVSTAPSSIGHRRRSPLNAHDAGGGEIALGLAVLN
ncbi:MAG: hypothetical protein HC869_11875 [Rhodospirillales bacterium]|nr:hypothetical protein [Rhodospirillales bacterium]